MVIKRVGVFSLAKLQAMIGAGLGLIIGVPVGLIMMVFGAALMSQGGQSRAGGGVGVGLGLFYMILLPIMYCVFGFIFGALTALIYNIASGFIGGLELEMESAAAEYSTPPPPQWGAGQYQPPPQHPY